MRPLLFFLTLASASAAQSDDIVIGDTQGHHQNERYVWTISKERLTKLPLWKKDGVLPLSPQRAEAIAYAWSRRQRLLGFIPDRPFVISLVAFPAPFQDRYFYKVHFASPDGRDLFWTVHILMDGSIVEPTKKEPNQTLEPTPTSVTPPAAQESRRP